jgi:hypothetical protein
MGVLTTIWNRRRKAHGRARACCQGFGVWRFECSKGFEGRGYEVEALESGYLIKESLEMDRKILHPECEVEIVVVVVGFRFSTR